MAEVNNKELFRGGLAKILKEQIQVDVLLKASDNDDVISAHKCILSGRSEVFKKMLESDEIKTSAKLETITLSDMNHEALEAFIDFIYGNGTALSEKENKHVRSLYVAADKYMIPRLRDLCRNELLSSLNSSNAAGILDLAQIPFDKVLNDVAFNVIVKNMITVSKSDEFKRFVVNHPIQAVEIIKSFSESSICRWCGKSYHCCNYCLPR